MSIRQRIAVVVDGEEVFNSGMQIGMEIEMNMDRDIDKGRRYIDYKAPDTIASETFTISVTQGRRING